MPTEKRSIIIELSYSGCTYMDLAEYLQEALEKRGWKASRLAKEAGVSHVYIGYILKRCDPNTGKPPNPTAEMLKSIARGLNESPDKLFAIVYGKSQTTPPSTGENAVYEKAIKDLLKSLPPELLIKEGLARMTKAEVKDILNRIEGNK